MGTVTVTQNSNVSWIDKVVGGGGPIDPNTIFSPTQVDDLIYVRAPVIPDGGVSDQASVLQALVNTAPMGSIVTLPSTGIVRFSEVTVPTGVSIRSNGCKVYKSNFKFKPSTAQEYNMIFRDVWFKQCTFDVSGAGDAGTVTSSTTTTITDNTKNWPVNKFAGATLKVSGLTSKTIISNTATTITIAGTSPYGSPPTVGLSYSIVSYTNAIVFDHCFIDGTDLNNADKTKGTTVNQTSMVNAITIGEFGFDVHLVNGTRICNYQGWAIDIHGNETDDLSGTPYLATGVFVTMSDTKIFNCGGQGNAGTVTSATSLTLTDTGKNWPIDYYKGWYVRILTGTGATQLRIVKSNTSNTLTLLDNAPFTSIPSVGGTFDFYCGGGFRFLGGCKDGGSVHMSNVLFDHCQQAWFADDGVGGVPTASNAESGGITILGNNIRIETCGNINEQYYNTQNGTGTRSAPVIYNSRGNVTINGLWYSSAVEHEADYRNIWHRFGEFNVRGGKFVNRGTSFAIFCDPGVTAIWDIPTANNYAIGAIRPVLTAESASNLGQEMVMRLRISKARGATGTSTGVGTTTTLTDTTKNWVTNIFKGATIRITGGTGNGATNYTITGNTTNTITISGTFSSIPDATSTYTINPGLRAQNINIYGAGFGLGNNPTGEQFSSVQSDVFVNNDTSAVVGSNLYNTVYYRLNTTSDSVTVTLAYKTIRCVMNASVVAQNAGLTNIYPDILLRNGTANFTLAFRDVNGAPINLLTSLGDGDNGRASSATTTTLTDSTKSWTVDQFRNCTLKIVSGTGVVPGGVITGQADDLYTITSNTATTLTIAGTFQITPDNTSYYVITGKQIEVICRIGIQKA